MDEFHPWCDFSRRPLWGELNNFDGIKKGSPGHRTAVTEIAAKQTLGNLRQAAETDPKQALQPIEKSCTNYMDFPHQG